MNATSSPKPMRERLRATATVLKAQLAAINAMLEEMATMIDDEPQPPRQAEEPGKGRLLNGSEAAEYLGISPNTLANLRWKGGGPAFCRLGTAIRYSKTDLDAWAAAGRRRSTSDQGETARKGEGR
jgi:excisionase family DNA binding protein